MWLKDILDPPDRVAEKEAWRATQPVSASERRSWPMRLFLWLWIAVSLFLVLGTTLYSGSDVLGAKWLAGVTINVFNGAVLAGIVTGVAWGISKLLGR